MSLTTEADIFSRLIDVSNPSLSPASASAILDLGFTESDHARMAELAEKSSEGTITAEEHREFQGYVFVGDILSMVKAKARASLRARPLAD